MAEPLIRGSVPQMRDQASLSAVRRRSLGSLPRFHLTQTRGAIPLSVLLFEQAYEVNGHSRGAGSAPEGVITAPGPKNPITLQQIKRCTFRRAMAFSSIEAAYVASRKPKSGQIIAAAHSRLSETASCQCQAARRVVRLGLGTRQPNATPLAPHLS